MKGSSWKYFRPLRSSGAVEKVLFRVYLFYELVSCIICPSPVSSSCTMTEKLGGRSAFLDYLLTFWDNSKLLTLPTIAVKFVTSGSRLHVYVFRCPVTDGQSQQLPPIRSLRALLTRIINCPEPLPLAFLWRHVGSILKQIREFLSLLHN